MAAATAAMDGLQGRDIFRGCCTLQIEYSKRRELTVKPNSPHMRDFTIADSGSPAATPASAPSAGADRHQAEPHSGAPPPARDRRHPVQRVGIPQHDASGLHGHRDRAAAARRACPHLEQSAVERGAWRE